MVGKGSGNFMIFLGTLSVLNLTTLTLLHSWRPRGDPTHVEMPPSYSWPAIHTEIFLGFSEGRHRPPDRQRHLDPLCWSGAGQNLQIAEVSLRPPLQRDSHEL